MSHEASRTGAPVMFLHFLRWLKDNTDLDFEILLLAGGPLADDFAAVAPLTHIEALGTSARSYLEGGLAKAGLPKLGDRLKVSRSRQAVDHLRCFDALYLNSTTSAVALRILPEIPPVVVSHVHELDAAFRYWFPENDRRAMLDHTTRFVSCAGAVAVNLIGGWRIPRDTIATHYEFIVPPAPTAGSAAKVRADLGIPESATIIGGAGSVIWRKGPDLFLQLAATVRRLRPDLDAHFVWVGGASDEKVPTRVDAQRMGIDDRVHFVGEVAKPDDIYGIYDVFALTSREDPYPLVMLESASLGVPVVSFANGGAVEFAGRPEAAERRAIVVPYLDVEAMAEALIPLVENEGERRALGRRGQRHVLANHTTEVAAPALYQELRSALSGAPTTRRSLAPLPPRERRLASAGPDRPVGSAGPVSKTRSPFVAPAEQSSMSFSKPAPLDDSTDSTAGPDDFAGPLPQ
ncbi:MAG: glycosyltransferase family 4 protein [Acidimicrobiales bacterium]|nr:glycosyltransferase family 4 protein [Acidimicrobiales bacterium]